MDKEPLDRFLLMAETMNDIHYSYNNIFLSMYPDKYVVRKGSITIEYQKPNDLEELNRFLESNMQ